MTALVIEPLVTELEQAFTLSLDGRHVIQAVRPYVYMHGAPSGIFTFSIEKDLVELWSESFTSASIKTSLETSNNYARIKLNLLADYLKLSKGNYVAKLAASGYTYSDSSFMAWIKPHEDIFTEISGTPANDSENPLGLELLSIVNIERVR